MGQYASKSKKTQQNLHSLNPTVARIALVLALPEERDYFHSEIIRRPGWTASTPRQRFVCDYASTHGNVRMTVQTLDNMGHIEAVLGTTSIIGATSPNLVVMLGIAGSLQPNVVGLGDVVVSNQVKYYASDKVADCNSFMGINGKYSFGKREDLNAARKNGKIVVDERDRFLKHSFLRYERNFIESTSMHGIISESEKVLKRARLAQISKITLPQSVLNLDSNSRDRAVHFGWILGSNHVVDSAEYRDYLNDKNGLLDMDVHRQKGDAERVKWTTGDLMAVDMESYGLLKAVEKARTTPSSDGGCQTLFGGLTVRGISDVCEFKNDLDERTSNEIRRIAVANATEVALTLLESIDYDRLTYL
jgi:nucleoside phosphorylase